MAGTLRQTASRRIRHGHRRDRNAGLLLRPLSNVQPCGFDTDDEAGLAAHPSVLDVKNDSRPTSRRLCDTNDEPGSLLTSKIKPGRLLVPSTSWDNHWRYSSKYDRRTEIDLKSLDQGRNDVRFVGVCSTSTVCSSYSYVAVLDCSRREAEAACHFSSELTLTCHLVVTRQLLFT
jgi:hypothetical protein